jgi:NAD(P)H-dependent flavin oxidoreductase YrpB (nitropropane dioxygenase family)
VGVYPHTALFRTLSISLPIVQAPVGSATTVRLAAAVSQAGALGSLALSWRTPGQIRVMLRRLRSLTGRPYAVNLVLEWDMRERLAVCLAEGARVVSLFWGDPRRYVPEVHAAGGRVMHTVGSAEEARRAADAGVDVIVAQGWEAGGHVRGQVTTMALVPAVVDAAGDVPVIAAGGIADGRGIAAALALGAAGAMLGTGFLVAEEADTHQVYRDALCQAGAADAAHMLLFEGGWPNAPHRALANATYRRWRAAGSPPAGGRPDEGQPVATRGGMPLARYGDDIPTTDTEGAVGELAMYAGQSVGLITGIEPARRIVRRLDQQTRDVLAGLRR